VNKFEAEREKLISENRKLNGRLSTQSTTGQDASSSRLVALEHELERLQEALKKQAEVHLKETAALEQKLKDASMGYQQAEKGLTSAQDETAIKVAALHAGLEGAREAHEKLAAELAQERAKEGPTFDIESVTASIQTKLEQYVVAAVNDVLEQRRYSGQAGNKDDSNNGMDLRRSILGVLRGLYETRTEAVDWLLDINGARVELASPSFVNAPSIYGAIRWLLPGLQVSHLTHLRMICSPDVLYTVGGPSNTSASGCRGDWRAFGSRRGYGWNRARTMLGNGRSERIRQSASDPADHAKKTCITGVVLLASFLL
jgi:hypothetical protein